MANLPISGLTASAANLAATDVLPVVQTTGVGPVKMTGLQIKTGIVGAGSVSIASGKTFTSSNTLTLAGTDSTTITFGGASSSFPIVTNPSGAIFQLGAADAASAVAQTLQVQGVVAGTSNTAGANFTIRGSDSTGNAAGGSIIFQVAPAGSSGTAQNAYQTVLQITGAGGITGQDGTTANTLALRNGTSAQTLRVYGTYTDATVYERVALSSTVGSFTLAAEGGTGSSATIDMNLTLKGTGAAIKFTTDNAWDIGASGATRPRTGYFGTQVRVGAPTATASAVGHGILASGSASGFQFVSESTATPSGTSGGVFFPICNSGAAMTIGARLGGFFFGGSSSATDIRAAASIAGFANQAWVDGSAYGSRFEFQTTANNSTTRTTKLIIGNSGVITFGATEANSVPALKPSSTTLQVRLGDDSAAAPLSASQLTASSTTANVSAIATTGYSLTGSSAVNMVDLAGTWNTTGVPTGIKLNITNTASGAGSLLLDLQVGGTSEFKVDKDGNTTWADAANLAFGTTTGTKIGTATSQKIGFWNKAPIVQPTTAVAEATFVENSGGTAVNVDSTFGGYTLQQVVQALQNMGLLA